MLSTGVVNSAITYYSSDMEKKVHFDASYEERKSGGNSIDEDLNVTLKDRHNITVFSDLAIEKDADNEFREIHSPIHSHHKVEDNDTFRNSTPRLTQQWQSAEETEMSQTVRGRLAETFEDEGLGYVIELPVIGESSQQSDRNPKPETVLDSPSIEIEVEETTPPAGPEVITIFKSLSSRVYDQLFYWTSYYPIFTFSIMFVNWVFFIWGIVWIIGWENANVSFSTPVSPPQSIFPFITVNDWPSCTSARGNTWRLVSAQFTHGGIAHIGGNTLAAIIYGTILECSHPFHWVITILAYEMGCIFGCLGHSYVWPFEGMIGCSTGIYGLIGCCISHIILDKDMLDPFLFKVLVVALGLQGTYDLVTYFHMYNPAVAYAGHCTGFFIGIFIGLSFGLLKKQIWKKIVGSVGVVSLLVLTVSLVAHYVNSWPPRMLAYNPTFHDYNRRSCCGDLYGVTNSTFSLEKARQSYVCDGIRIYDWHKT